MNPLIVGQIADIVATTARVLAATAEASALSQVGDDMKAQELLDGARTEWSDAVDAWDRAKNDN